MRARLQSQSRGALNSCVGLLPATGQRVDGRAGWGPPVLFSRWLLVGLPNGRDHIQSRSLCIRLRRSAMGCLYSPFAARALFFTNRRTLTGIDRLPVCYLSTAPQDVQVCRHCCGCCPVVLRGRCQVERQGLRRCVSCSPGPLLCSLPSLSRSLSLYPAAILSSPFSPSFLFSSIRQPPSCRVDYVDWKVVLYARHTLQPWSPPFRRAMAMMKQVFPLLKLLAALWIYIVQMYQAEPSAQLH